MKWRYHPVAAEEFLEGCACYRATSAELARAFYRDVEDGIEKILRGPRQWVVIEGDVRRFPMRRFPYGIYYTLVDDDEVVLIVAVMHMRRRPGTWRDRVSRARGRC